ncbi:MAG: RDD family protein [Epsilonproteobacteria bacterium]|nr:RDD family protein [Campylobacterota bacterium]
MEEIIDTLNREEIKVASLGKRIIAMSIDDLLVSVLVFIAFWDKFQAIKSYEEMILLVDKMFVFIFAAFILYHYIFVALYGKTLGKMAVKIRVIDIKTLDNPSHLTSLIRSVVRYFDEAFFYLGMLYAVVDPLNRAIHDIAGMAVVVEDF